MNEDWNVPLAPEDWIRLLDDLVAGLPEHAQRLGITPEMAAHLRAQRESFRAERNGAMESALGRLRARLVAHCPEPQWPILFRETFARLRVTREPDRTRMLELLETWIQGIERVRGGDLRVQLSPGWFDEGIVLTFTRPRLCDSSAVYYRIQGRAAWQFFCMDSQMRHHIYTAPEYEEQQDELKKWPGRTLQFVSFGCLDCKPIGFPSEIVELVVPQVYPIPIKRKTDS